MCQMCDAIGHTGTSCPWVYTHCKVPYCTGIMFLMVSQEKDTYGKKGLTCQYEKCHGFEWLEDAMNKNEASSSTAPFHASKKEKTDATNNVCFQCGEEGHWARNCPWKETLCPNGCQATRKLWTSYQQHSYGKKFLKCINCGNFEWLIDAISKRRNLNVRVKLDISIDDLCSQFNKKF